MTQKIQTLGEMEAENPDVFKNPERKPEDAAYWAAVDAAAAIRKEKEAANFVIIDDGLEDHEGYDEEDED